MNRPEFSVSLMCADLMRVGEQLDVLNKRADYYHVDIMDGHFAPNITLSPDFVKAAYKHGAVPMDMHLMTMNPGDWIETLANNGASTISAHAETINVNAFRTMGLVRQLGCQVGVVLNPATPLTEAQHYLNRVDLLTLMTVDVGFAGQPFITEVLRKVEQAVAFREKEGLSYKIQIDGSCNEGTFRRLRAAGGDVFILGTSGLFNLDPDLNVAWDKMLDAFERETGESGRRSDDDA